MIKGKLRHRKIEEKLEKEEKSILSMKKKLATIRLIPKIIVQIQ